MEVVVLKAIRHRSLIVGAALLCLPGAAWAQRVEVIRHTDLQFGELIRGDVVQVQPTEMGAAKFSIRRSQGRPTIHVSFGLPPALAQGEAALPIEFGATSAAWAEGDVMTGRTTFDPAQGVTLRMSPQADIYIWVGGTVRPTAQQAAGSYMETITLYITEL